MTRPTAQYKADLDLWTNRHNGVRSEPRRAITLHTDESAYDYSKGTVRTWGWTAKRLAEYNREPGVRGSYHLGVDNGRQVVRQVNDRGGTWSVGSRGNNESIHICMAGTTAHWTRAQWLAKPDLLDQTAIVVAHTALFHGIPIRKIGPKEVAANKWGITDHDAWSKGVGGSDHWDVGPHFPWDHFIDLVKKHEARMTGATVIEHDPAPTPTDQGEDMSFTDDDREKLNRIHHELTHEFGSRFPGSSFKDTMIGYLLEIDRKVEDMHAGMLPWLAGRVDGIKTAIKNALSREK